MSNEISTETKERIPLATMSLIPTTFGEIVKFADIMSKSTLIPTHLQNKPADCVRVIMQATRWEMDPFPVADCTSIVKGKLMFEGKLVAAVVNSSGLLDKGTRLDYEYSGAGDDRQVVVTGVLNGVKKPVEVKLKDARTGNDIWLKQPDQQLAYAGARVWARRWTPELMLGVSVKGEIEEEMIDITPAPEKPRTTAGTLDEFDTAPVKPVRKKTDKPAPVIENASPVEPPAAEDPFAPQTATKTEPTKPAAAIKFEE